ncbi:Zn-dependent exopeptidase [Mycena albidolilacea]|uniref:Peptide hydrolase n=1 Tax=Mycena albidolilacea TaxID=1033008 RepID=A0AAD7AVB1_9AGAR|nr:Zn-dependent exopeptidase [Mycena albidolilacea]
MIPLAGALLLVVPFAPSLFDTCLSSNYYGNYNDGPTPYSIFLPDAACLDLWSSQTLAPLASISEAKHAIQQLVWVEQEAVDYTLIATIRSFRPEFDSFLQRLTAPKRMGRDQDVLVAPERETMGYELLYQTPTAALLSVSESTARTIDMLLPRFWKSSLLSTTPVDFLPVPDKAVKHVKEVLANLRFNPDVAAIVDSISVPQMINDIRFLTGEDGVSGIVSRHSFAEGSRVAASWLKARFEETGATCELQPFLQGFAPNVICAYPSTVNTTATVLLSAHYDSRGSFGSTRAPGGDDDGSGTMAILAIARTIARKGIKFQSNVQLAAFAGEEQGLLGSKAYARKLRDIDANITVMIQADMLAYRKQGEPPQLGLPFTIGTTEVTQLVANVSAIYSPELKVGFTAACCSDHQSFHEQGFPATQVFERAGDIVDPMYHNSGDLSDREGYDFGQVKSIAKVQLATLLHAAGYELPSESD